MIICTTLSTLANRFDNKFWKLVLKRINKNGDTLEDAVRIANIACIADIKKQIIYGYNTTHNVCKNFKCLKQQTAVYDNCVILYIDDIDDNTYKYKIVCNHSNYVFVQMDENSPMAKFFNAIACPNCIGSDYIDIYTKIGCECCGGRGYIAI